jgi:serine/threonine protein phosphatase PrpC
VRARGWAVTDVGRKRDHNEDSFLCNNELGLYAVADGMGGHFGGERASRMAVEALEDHVSAGLADATKAAAGITSRPEAGVHPIAATLRAATVRAARSIYDEAQKSASHTGMGTTLTAALFHDERVTICHVGDSRAYLYRDGRARQLTEDHSWIQEQIRAGLITEEDALVSRFRNIITRSVGFEPSVEPDLLTLPVEPGDCFLLCSDGLSNYLTVAEIERVFTSEFYANAGTAFVEMANERGGDDNITCVVTYLGNIGE